MITAAEYFVHVDELRRLAEIRSRDIANKTADVKTASELIEKGKESSLAYSEDAENLMLRQLRDSGNEAFEHYKEVTGLDITEQDKDLILDNLINKQLDEHYYGKNWWQRLKLGRKILEYNIVKSAAVGKTIEQRRDHVIGVLDKAYPFGAHINNDKRLLLSEVVRLEQKIAQEFANLAGLSLIQWTLSRNHAKPDMCDDLATYTSKSVVKYIEENNLKISPRGIYFADELPPLPHPNCQCNFVLVEAQPSTHGIFKRTARRLSNLVRRLRK